MWHGRKQRNREGGNSLYGFTSVDRKPKLRGEQKKKVILKDNQIKRATEIYFKWQAEGTDGTNYAEPELTALLE